MPTSAYPNNAASQDFNPRFSDSSRPDRADTQDELARLDDRLTRLAHRLAMRDADFTSILQRQAELEGQINLLLESKAEPRLPRPFRVLKKRLRKMGLLPPLTKKVPATTVAEAQALQLARRHAPAELLPYLQEMDRYQSWCVVNKFTDAARRELEQDLSTAQELPRISIVTPVYNTSPRHLDELLTSVLGQVYSDWELRLVDDGSNAPETLKALSRLEGLDSRIHILRAGTNLGISGATNLGVASAEGDVIVFVDHDDLLTPDCLGEIALYYAKHPEADIVYSDDDKIDDQGRRFAPQFKPEWSPSLLLSFMYISHTFTVRRSLYINLGGFDSQFDGAQDFDFALRASEHARHVGHIPKVLYHWRTTPGSTAISGDAKPESFERGRQAVENALLRRGIEGRVLHPDWAKAAKVGMFEIEFPDEGPLVTIIIPTFNKAELLRDCLASLTRVTYRNHDILVIDNGSDEPETLSYLQSIAEEGIRVVRIPQRAEGFSYAALMNQAAAEVSSEFILFLNNDTVVRSDNFLSQMVGYAQMPGVGAVGARLYFKDGSIQHAGIVHGYNDGLVGHAFRNLPPHDWGYLGFVRTAREYSAVTAACMLTPRALFLAHAGFDDKNFAVAYNDVDYCYRLVNQGYRCIYVASAELFHLEGKTRSRHDAPEEVINLRRIYGDWKDRWYNPNLSLANEKFEVAPRHVPSRSAAPLRVAAVSHNLEREGAPNTLFDLIVGLKRAGIVDPVILSPRDGPLASQYADSGIIVEFFTPPPVGCPDADFVKLTERLAQQLRRLAVDVVVVNTVPMFAAVSAAALAEIPVIWSQHESEAWHSYFDAEVPRVRARAFAAFSQAYCVTYVADATRNGWAPLHLRHNSRTIRHGIPPERQAIELAQWDRKAARERLKIADHEIGIILMGTVCERKGQIDLIEAAQHLPFDVRRNVRIFLVGAHAEPPYRDRLLKMLSEIDPDISARIQLTGAVKDMSLYYAAADISVSTSRIESAPRTLVESMVFGLPIVSTPVFGIPELLDFGVNALSYPPGASKVLAETLVQLVRDTALRQAMGAKSPLVLQSRPGYAEMLDQYTTLLREAVMLGDDLPSSSSESSFA
ncbi:glycosyltransferase [Brevundimonas phoenicis]|uniref:glycosyltransferase n=1 Tax=unclassified Brevundimonas TaxID=2622653 RepID=UPI0039A200D8